MTMFAQQKPSHRSGDLTLSEPQEAKPTVQKNKNKLFRKRHAKKQNKSSYRSKINFFIGKKLRRCSSIDTLPSTPHNTTQFIVDNAYFPTDPQIYGYEMDSIEYNFSHHAMAGSMMAIMQEKFDKEENAVCNQVENKTEDCQVNYDNYLKEAEKQENLGDIIKELVHVIKQKDNELNFLLADNRNKAICQ